MGNGKKRKLNEQPTLDLSNVENLKRACIRLFEIKEQLAQADESLEPLRSSEKQLEDALATWLQSNQQPHLEVDDQRQIVLTPAAEPKDIKPNAKDFEAVLPLVLPLEALQAVQSEMMKRLQAKGKRASSKPSVKAQTKQFVDM